MAHDVGTRTSAYLTELLEANHLEWSVNGDVPDMTLVDHITKRLSRLLSLRRQVERLEDELELMLVSAGRGTTGPPVRSEGDMLVALDELNRLVEELKGQRGDESDG